MALGPQLPESQHRVESRLMDRAVFLGDLGRSGRNADTQARQAEKAHFLKMLEEEVEEEEELNPEPAVGEEAAPGEAGAAPAGPEPAPDAQMENRLDAERQSRRGEAGEAEKASASHWRGMHSPVGLGQAMASTLSPQIRAQALEKQQQSQKQRDTGQGEGIQEDTRHVDHSLLQSLREAGLAQPLTGFSDPRLRSGPPQLGPDWSHQDVPGGRVMRWDSGGVARQVLRWSARESLLETIVPGKRQVIQKMGEQILSSLTPWEEGQDFQLPTWTTPP